MRAGLTAKARAEPQWSCFGCASRRDSLPARGYFFCNDTATTEIYTLSLHDALPIWHLTRVQDDHVAAAFGVPQVWSAGGWADRFGLPPTSMDTGYGHSSQQVAAVCARVAAAELLADYHEATYEQTVKLVSAITDADLELVIDTSWHPPVTLGVRLVSVINDDMQHAGQAAFVRGILQRAAL